MASLYYAIKNKVKTIALNPPGGPIGALEITLGHQRLAVSTHVAEIELYDATQSTLPAVTLPIRLVVGGQPKVVVPCLISNT